MTSDPARDLDLILETAREAGALAMALREGGLDVAWKEGNSPVTNADLAADALIRQRLAAARPDYGWLSEETADSPERLGKRRLFVVDPIDGTRAFLKGRPWWSVSIAVVEDGQPTAGAVFAPQLDEAYAARIGGGASLNGAPIRAAATASLEDCAMIGDPRMFSHPAWPSPWPPMRVASRSSTAYRMCLVAAGAADAALALVSKADWDLAAADLIAREAGAFVGDHRGRPFAYNAPQPAQASLLCATQSLAPLIMERVRHIAI